MQRLILSGGSVILPDAVLESASVVIENDTIAAVERRIYPAGRSAREQVVDIAGRHVVPGLVDLHNDGLETEINPRPGTNLPLPFALANLDRQLAATGITTEFHAVFFGNMTSKERRLEQAVDRALAIVEHGRSGRALVDHQVLFRLDLWTPESLEKILATVGVADVPLVSLNDHTPGQGQFRDIDGYIARMKAYEETRGATPLDVDGMLATIAKRAADTETLPAIYGRLRAEHERRPLIIATHDDDSARKVDFAWGLGARVAEFPVTVEAARRQRELDMPILVGAPNIVRGGSQSGNLDARELIGLGLADIICADYHAPSLLPSAFRLADEGFMDLPAAIRMLTLNPARAVGLTDRGAIEPGLSADLALARLDGAGFPCVEQVFRAGRPVFSFLQAAPSAALTAR